MKAIRQWFKTKRFNRLMKKWHQDHADETECRQKYRRYQRYKTELEEKLGIDSRAELIKAYAAILQLNDDMRGRKK